MRFVLLILIFSAIIGGFFYAFDPSKGNMADKVHLSNDVRNELKKLPRP